MPKQADQSRISGFAFQDDICNKSLELFGRRLEKEYYADALIRIFEYDLERFSLVVDLQSKLTLVELLYHMQETRVGQTPLSMNNDLNNNAFVAALSDLRQANGYDFDVEELTFFLADSEITIKRIYEYSIEDQIGNISKELIKHFNDFSNNQSDIPSEIFIPVFEVNLKDQLKYGNSGEYGSLNQRDYFNFWGIYFSHNDDAVIYDLSKRSIISGDLHMLD